VAHLLSLTEDDPFERTPPKPNAFLRTPPLSKAVKRSGNTDVGYSMPFAQDHAQEAIVNGQRAVARIIDKAQRPKLVHEMTDPRPGGAIHLSQVFLIDSGMDRFGSAVLAKMRQQ